MEMLELLSVLALSSDGLVTEARGFFLPIILLVVGLAGVGYLAAQRMSGLVGFLLVAVLVVSILTTPQMIENIGRWLGTTLT